MNVDQNNLNMQGNNELFNKLKILNKIDAAIEFICALGLLIFIFYLFTLGPGQTSGLFLLAIPFIIAIIIGLSIFVFLNIRNCKNLNMSSTKMIAIIEIIGGLLFQVFGIPVLIVSIMKLYLLSKNK